MIVGKDTLPFKAIINITSDTSHKNGQTFITFDTTYTDPCQTFEKQDRKIISRTDSNCVKQGIWKYSQSNGIYATSFYIDGDDDGLNRFYDKNNKLLREIETASIGRDFYTITEIEYVNSIPVIKINRPVFGFYVRHFQFMLFLSIGLLFIRTVINNNIYNIENNSDFSAVRTSFIAHRKSGELKHLLLIFFTICFFRYKPENKYAVIVSNLISAFLIITVVTLVSSWF